MQALFLFSTVYIGYRFYQFVHHFLDPARPFVERPPSVDAFLPIGGLMATKYFLFTGMVEPVHPAGFVLFIGILVISLLMKKAFCGWICPIGTVSQLLWMAGEKLFGRNFRIIPQVDIPLRAVKYVLLALFILLIGVAMTPNMMLLFFITDYYKAVDVKMMMFFTHMSAVTMWTLAALFLLSFLYKNVWCRYLCPYGALLGLLSKISPAKIERSDEKCIHCGACSRHCPSLIDVAHSVRISSSECFGCLTCASHCPSPEALDMKVKTKAGRKVVKPALFGALVVLLFYGFIMGGRLAGHWQTQVPYEDFARIIPAMYSDQETATAVGGPERIETDPARENPR